MQLFAHKHRFLLPHFLEFQRKSYSQFLTKGLIQELIAHNPITYSPNGLKIVFYPEEYCLRTPSATLRKSILEKLNPTLQVLVPIRLLFPFNQRSAKEWAIIGQIPLMTERGHFIINGSPRVVINQLLRSPGVYYSALPSNTNNFEGMQLAYYADFIPHRGSWLRIEIDRKGRLWARMRSSAKFPLLLLLHFFHIPIETNLGKFVSHYQRVAGFVRASWLQPSIHYLNSVSRVLTEAQKNKKNYLFTKKKLENNQIGQKNLSHKIKGNQKKSNSSEVQDINLSTLVINKEERDNNLTLFYNNKKTVLELKSKSFHKNDSISSLFLAKTLSPNKTLSTNRATSTLFGSIEEVEIKTPQSIFGRFLFEENFKKKAPFFWDQLCSALVPKTGLTKLREIESGLQNSSSEHFRINSFSTRQILGENVNNRLLQDKTGSVAALPIGSERLAPNLEISLNTLFKQTYKNIDLSLFEKAFQQYNIQSNILQSWSTKKKSRVEANKLNLAPSLLKYYPNHNLVFSHTLFLFFYKTSLEKLTNNNSVFSRYRAILPEEGSTIPLTITLKAVRRGLQRITNHAQVKNSGLLSEYNLNNQSSKTKDLERLILSWAQNLSFHVFPLGMAYLFSFILLDNKETIELEPSILPPKKELEQQSTKQIEDFVIALLVKQVKFLKTLRKQEANLKNLKPRLYNKKVLKESLPLYRFYNRNNKKLEQDHLSLYQPLIHKEFGSNGKEVDGIDIKFTHSKHSKTENFSKSLNFEQLFNKKSPRSILRQEKKIISNLDRKKWRLEKHYKTKFISFKYWDSVQNYVFKNRQKHLFTDLFLKSRAKSIKTGLKQINNKIYLVNKGSSESHRNDNIDKGSFWNKEKRLNKSFQTAGIVWQPSSLTLEPFNLHAVLQKVGVAILGESRRKALKKKYLYLNESNQQYAKELTLLDQGDWVNKNKLFTFIYQRLGKPQGYSLGRLGRFRLNTQFKNRVPQSVQTLTSTDLVSATERLLLLRTDKGESDKLLNNRKLDDIDHLKNRRVRGTGELFQLQWAFCLQRLERLIRKKLELLNSSASFISTLENEKSESAQTDPFLPNSFWSFSISNKPSFFKAAGPRLHDNSINKMKKVVRQTMGSFGNPDSSVTRPFSLFFGSSPISQTMDAHNPLAEITHKRRISALGPGGINRDNASMAVRNIHTSYYGRICPIETPEGHNAGLVNSLSSFGKVNTLGALKSPTYKVCQGYVLREEDPIFLTAEGEEHVRVAPGDLELSPLNLLPTSLLPTKKGDIFVSHWPGQTDYVGISSMQMISLATALVPFVEHNDGNRALMASNMQRQAEAPLKPERPIVGVGLEGRVVADSGYSVTAQAAGFVSYIGDETIQLETLPHKTNLNLFTLNKKDS